MEQKQEKAAPQLPPNDLQIFEQISTRYDARIQQGVKPEDLLAPAFWAHKAVLLRPMDEIRARAEDGTWVAYLLVLDTSRTWARVKMVDLVNLGTADVALSQAAEEEVKRIKGDFKVTFRGPHKWSVVRKLDNQVMVESIQEKVDAEIWIDRHAREQASAPPPETVAA
jgi:hypothetical protein